MKTKKTERKWTSIFQQASNEVSNWRQKHPKVSFTEIEDTVDEQLAKVRVAMIEELVQESDLIDFKQLPPEE